MNSTFDANNRRALEDFLYELICEMQTPDETELLVDVLLTIQHRPSVPHARARLLFPSDHPAASKQGRGG